MGRMHDMMNIEVTNICNAHCSFCPREKMTRPLGTMSFELFKKIIDECAENNVGEINITGYGEPLIDKEIAKKVNYIKSKYNPIVVITTNGSLLTKSLAKDLINSGLDDLNISFYNMTKNNESSQINHKKIMDNAKAFSNLKKEMKRKLPRLVANYICNTSDKKETQKCMAELGGIADKVIYHNLHNFVYAMDYNRVNPTKLRMSCMNPESKVQVEWDGTVIGCCYDFDAKIVLGNANENSISEIINSKKYNELVRNLALRRFNRLPICNSCDQLTQLTFGNALKRIFYIAIKRPIERRERKNLFKKLRKGERNER